ncbi:hypothetical protein [Asticcacaulis sp. EMRT-3]|uniref:hypothetical protein n=1 Tax=Asticcacaulis sp. EMRT-3 TaxID=3040349 RepID=UPI0024AF4352|nr:hypothetical protein [Asticcacaulis sp. EMRT-3]MDI7775340.1 hypothetical protein [Asticcacaulis sp. EMRT-3]
MSRTRKPAAKPSVHHVDSITPQGRAINSGQEGRPAQGARPAPHQPGQAKQQARQQTGQQTGKSHDPNRIGGFGMADPADQPARRDQPKGATPAPSHHFNDDRDRQDGIRRHAGSQPGAQDIGIDDTHPEREGYAQPESQKGLQGDGHDERGDYGRGPPPGAHQGENERKDQ